MKFPANTVTYEDLKQFVMGVAANASQEVLDQAKEARSYNGHQARNFNKQIHRLQEGQEVEEIDLVRYAYLNGYI